MKIPRHKVLSDTEMLERISTSQLCPSLCPVRISEVVVCFIIVINNSVPAVPVTASHTDTRDFNYMRGTNIQLLNDRHRIQAYIASDTTANTVQL